MESLRTTTDFFLLRAPRFVSVFFCPIYAVSWAHNLTESTPWRGPSALAPCRYDEGKVDPPSPPLSLTGGAVVLYRVQELLRLLCPCLVDMGLFTGKI